MEIFAAWETNGYNDKVIESGRVGERGGQMETEREREMSRVEWGDWMHAECEVSIELLYARLACGCHGHFAAERWVSRRVSRCLLRELSNDVVTGCNRGDSSDIRQVSQVELLLSAGRRAAKSTAVHSLQWRLCETFSLSIQRPHCQKPIPGARDGAFCLCEIFMPCFWSFPIHSMHRIFHIQLNVQCKLDFREERMY